MQFKRFFAITVVVAMIALTACGNADQFAATNTLGSENGPVAIEDQRVGADISEAEELPLEVAAVEVLAEPSHGTVNADDIEKDRPASKDIVGTSKLKPTVYYFPIFDTDKTTCSANQKVSMYGEGGKTLIRVCKKISDACGMQGSCSIKKNGKIRLLNILARVKGQNRYFEIDRKECKYGYGVRTVCLDPFYTLAADLSIYKLGEVIYVPSVIGLILPDGSLHDGYFVIRDKGAGIMGRGRFDFYSGFMPWYDKENPFNKIGLANKNTEVPYMRVSGGKTKEIQARRNFPSIPKDSMPLQ